VSYAELLATVEALPLKGKKAVCPSHEDSSPSLTWALGDDGRLLLHCHAGCPVEAIVSALGASMADLYPDSNGKGPHIVFVESPTRRHAAPGERAFDAYYTDGTKAGLHKRSDDGRGEKRVWWDPRGVETKRLALYGAWDVLPEDPVVVVEGERTVLAVRHAGLSAVGTYGTGAPPSAAALEPLRGRAVVLWPDNDDVGRKHMDSIAGAIAGVAASVRIVQPPAEAPKGWDAADTDVETIHRLVGGAKGGPSVIRMSQIRSMPVEWVWGGWLPKGTVTLFDGNPGEAKSTAVMDLIARVTTGREWPDGQPGSEPADVLIITREDDPDRVLRPRLEVCRADLDRVLFLADEFVMPKDTPRLSEVVASYRGIAMVFIDPLFSHIEGHIKTISDNDVRTAVMTPLSHIASRSGIALLAMRHYSKDTSKSALLRGSGSLGGLAGAARSVWSATADPDDDTGKTKLVGVTKSNYAEKPGTLRYRVVSAQPPGEVWIGHTVSAVEWLGASHMSIDDVMSEEDHEKARTATDELVEFLSSRGGSAPADECLAFMASKRYAGTATKSAKRRAGVTSSKTGFEGGWVWSLPEEVRSPTTQSSSTPRTPWTPSEDDEEVQEVQEVQEVRLPTRVPVREGWCLDVGSHATSHRDVMSEPWCVICSPKEDA
jgi:putative DNA primase/helicase